MSRKQHIPFPKKFLQLCPENLRAKNDSLGGFEIVLANAAELAGEILGKLFPLYAGLLFVVDPAADLTNVLHNRFSFLVRVICNYSIKQNAAIVNNFEDCFQVNAGKWLQALKEYVIISSLHKSNTKLAPLLLLSLHCLQGRIEPEYVFLCSSMHHPVRNCSMGKDSA